MTEQVIIDSEATVDQGLTVLAGGLEAALAAEPVDAAAVMAMDRLRSRYTFQRLQLRRAEIIKIDESPAMQQAVASVASAAMELDDIHKNCQASIDWINKAAKGLDDLMAAVTTLKALS